MIAKIIKTKNRIEGNNLYFNRTLSMFICKCGLNFRWIGINGDLSASFGSGLDKIWFSFVFLLRPNGELKTEVLLCVDNWSWEFPSEEFIMSFGTQSVDMKFLFVFALSLFNSSAIFPCFNAQKTIFNVFDLAKVTQTF